VLDFPTFSESQADDSSNIAPIDKRNVVQTVPVRNETSHAQLIVGETVIDPDKGFIPNKLLRERQRKTVVLDVLAIFGWLELDAHVLV
jgi:hypothetical protein